MSTYSYTRITYRAGLEVHREIITIDGKRLYQEAGGVGRYAFLELVNRWNRTGQIGLANGGPLYVYIAEP